MPLAFITCSGTYSVTQADLNAGSIVNTASAQSGTTTSPPVTHTLTGTQTPALSLVKSTTTVSFNAAGVTIPYSYVVTNSGNVTLTALVSVSDNRIASVSCPSLPAGGLAPTQSITCTASYVTAQADVNAGGVTNTATAQSGSVVSAPRDVTVPAVQTPALAVLKTSTFTSYNVVGQSIPYFYRVTNSGNVTLTSAVTVADNRIAAVSCPALPAGGLAPGAFITCSGSYVVTQADVNAGSIVNTASAASGAVTSPPVSLTIPASQATGLTIVKSTTSVGFALPNTAIAYSYRVTNSGNVTLTNPVTVADNRIATVSCPALPALGLAPGASITCTASYLTTQGDIDAGGVTNTAQAASGAITSTPVNVTVPAIQTPALQIVKSTTASTYVAVGTLIPYSFTVTNSGNTTLTAAVTVTDSKIGTVLCPPIAPGLAPGGTVSCNGSYTVTQADLDGGNVVNTAFARSGVVQSPTVTYTLPGTQIPALTLAKTSTTTSVATVGQSVAYRYTLTNTGNVTLSVNPAVTDDKIASVTCPAMPVGGLLPTQSLICSATYLVTQADLDTGSVVNTAFATSGTPTVGTTSNTAALTIPAAQSPALAVVKSTTATTFMTVGAVIPYSFAVTNTGNVTITSAVTVSDNRIASVTCPALPPAGVAPLASITCTGSYTVTQADLDAGRIINTATARSGTTVSPLVTHTLTAGQTRALTLTKTPTTPGFTQAGAVLGYSYEVRNSGNVTIPATPGITIADNKIASVSCPALPAGGLIPGASITCLANYTVTQADMDAGQVTNLASATDGTVTSPQATATVTGTRTPSLSVVKSTTATGYAAVGVAIPYSFLVRNTGNVTLTTPITVSDNRIATVSCPALPVGGLLPNATLTCTGTTTTTQANLDTGSIVNTASATSGTTTSPPVTHTLTALQRRSLAIAKTPTPTTFGSTGVAIAYSYVVTNTGNVTIPATSPISVTDDKIASVACPSLPAAGLAPAASITCTASMTTTQAHVDAGSVTNIATATDGTSVSPPVSATVTAITRPSIALVKSTTAPPYATVGTVIAYNFRVTNNGNTTLTQAITVSDNKIPTVTCPALPAGGLVPGGFVVCTGSYTVTQADLDAGAVINTAVAQSGVLVSTPPTVHTLTGSQTRSLAMLKTTTATGFDAPGQSLAYSYRVTNTGNVTLTSAISINDDRIATVSCPALPAGGLAPGAFITCSATYLTTQADVDAGRVTNIAAATSGSTVSPTGTVTVFGTQRPGLTLVKSTPTSSFALPGATITYNFRVTNSGNTTVAGPITVADNRIASVSCPAVPVGGLAPAAAITCTGTYSTTQADVDAGGVTNNASARAGSLVSPTVSVTVPSVRTTGITLAKTASAATFSATGVTLNYSYRITNSGNITITGPVGVTDDRIAAVSCPALPVGGLLPAAFVTCTASYLTTQADLDAGQVTNIATASIGALTSAPATATVTALRSSGLTVVKTSPVTGIVAPGVTIPYSYRVTNAGNTTITAPITIADNRIAAVACPALPGGVLAPGAFITCTASYLTTQADVDAGGVTNTATARSGTVTSPTVTLTVPATRTPALTLVKSTPTTSVAAAGVSIVYSYVATNAGNTTLTSPITVSDNKIATVSCPALPAGGLAPAATLNCTGTYVVTQADIDAGGITNIATARSGSVTSPTATVTVPSVRTPQLSLVKSTAALSYNAAGQIITYSYRVTNSGNTTLTAAITVGDNRIPTVTCPALPAGGLAPSGTLVCSASYTITQADVDGGSVINTATARSGPVTSPTVSVTLPALQVRSIGIVKTSTVSSFATTGMVIPYSYRVTNTGNTTITTPVTVADNRIAAVTCPAIPAAGLLPAASITCTATATTTQADLDAGSITNTAVATSGSLTSPIVSLTINAVVVPGLTVVKTTTTTSFDAVGTVIPYSYRVTNSGNRTLLQPVTITDDRIAAVTCGPIPVTGLAPGGVITCTGTYTTTQADLDAGLVTNLARARSGAVSSPVVSVSVPAVQRRLMVLDKTTPVTVFSRVGEVIPYSYRVVNTGNVSFTAPITIADNRIAAVTCPALPVGGLAPGAVLVCTANYTTTQADLDAGGVTNTATARSGTTVSPTVSVTVPATQTTAIGLAKSSTTTAYATAGTVITYSYRVTNNGNTTLRTAVTVTDDRIAAVSCPALPAAGLAPAAFVTCTGLYTVTQADLDAGNVTNLATARSGALTSPQVRVVIPATQTRSISLLKTSTSTGYRAVGVVIPYTYTVRNTGNTTLFGALVVRDDKIPTVNCPALPPGGLAPNATLVCAASYTTTQDDLYNAAVTNIATATLGTLVSAPATLTITTNFRPEFTLIKTTTTPTSVTNADATYSAAFDIVIENTGDVDLTEVQATDDFLAQLPAGSVVTTARVISVSSSTRGTLSAANLMFGAAAPNAQLFSGSGIELAIGERVTTSIDISFRPSPSLTEASIENKVVATTVFNRGTIIARTATRTGTARVRLEPDTPLVVNKTTPKTDVTVGALVPYVITIRNTVAFARFNLTIVDVIPAGFKYRDGSASIDGVAREPTRNGRELTWGNVSMTGNGTVTLRLMLVAGAGLRPGEYTNEAFVRNFLGQQISNVGKVTVRIVGDPTFDCTDIIGKVFDDRNQNGVQDEGERGIANVRLATVRGELITTDSEGRYHITCADTPTSDRGTNFILKLDERTLPTGYRITTENPRVIRITKGKMAKMNFGATTVRTAQLDLMDGAFEPGTLHINAQWSAQIAQVIAALQTEKTILKLTYRRRASEDVRLADARIKAVEALIRSGWEQSGGAWRLTIDSQVHFDRRAQK